MEIEIYLEFPPAKKNFPKSLGEYEKISNNRSAVMHAAYQSGGYSLKDIGDYFDLHYSRVSKILAEEKKAKAKIYIRQPRPPQAAGLQCCSPQTKHWRLL
ncbi:MAG: hypothetical protein V4660_05340 [Pseudomonadota bacterium]